MKIHFEKGFGFLEVMIAISILGVGSFFVLEGYDMLTNSKVKIDKKLSNEITLSNIIESVRSNIIFEKVDFKAETTFLGNSGFEEVQTSLKLCLVNNGLIPLDNYPTCPGRLGYVVAPLKVGTLTLRGLYKVTIRLTHTQLFPGTFKQYEFIVKGP